jgi:hypothetical protein
MEALVLTDKPWHDPAAQWNCGAKDDRLLLLVGSEKERVCLSFTQQEAMEVMIRWTALVATREGADDA